MGKWKSKYMEIITPCCFVVFVVCSLYFMDKRDKHIVANGVWTIYRLEQVGAAPRGGKDAYAYYSFRGVEYKDGTGVGDYAREGGRYLMVLLPESPANKILYMGERVPSWFTLEAPAEGWPKKPTEDELREMMVRDSLTRGLKPISSIAKEKNNVEVEE